MREVRHFASLILQSSLGSPRAPKPPRWVAWHPSHEQVAILNVDGSCSGIPRRAGFGGLIREHDGSWVLGFYGYLGDADPLREEMEALYHGLDMAWSAGIRNLLCFSDSATAISLVSQGASSLHRYAPIISAIREVLQRQWTVRVQHTLREPPAESLRMLSAPPAVLRGVLWADAWRVYFERGVTLE